MCRGENLPPGHNTTGSHFIDAERPAFCLGREIKRPGCGPLPRDRGLRVHFPARKHTRWGPSLPFELSSLADIVVNIIMIMPKLRGSWDAVGFVPVAMIANKEVSIVPVGMIANKEVSRGQRAFTQSACLRPAGLAMSWQAPCPRASPPRPHSNLHPNSLNPRPETPCPRASLLRPHSTKL